MNVDGMPWYVPSAKTQSSEKPGQVQGHGMPADQRAPIQPLSRRETWRMIITAVSAALMIATIFLLGAFLFILFALHVWLK
jgi:hypothetical protein